MTKHIIGIGQQAAGQVAIIHGGAVQCDHGLPMLQSCHQCDLEDQGESDHALMSELSL